MTPSLADQCFRQGFERGLRKAAGTAGVLGRAELEALGERLFGQSVNPKNVWQGLRGAVLPGYAQRRQVMDALLKHGPGHPEVRDLYHQIGATAHPKIQFWGRNLPMAASATGGAGVGILGGSMIGAHGRQNEMDDQIRNMPLWDRLKYLVFPESLNAHQSYELPPSQSSPVPDGI